MLDYLLPSTAYLQRIDISLEAFVSLLRSATDNTSFLILLDGPSMYLKHWQFKSSAHDSSPLEPLKSCIRRIPRLVPIINLVEHSGKNSQLL